jgi:Flp pilus assembly protein TadB
VLTVVLLAMGLAIGIHPAALAIVAVAAVEPRIVLFGAAVWAVIAAVRRRSERITPDDEATYFRALAAELRAGASLRSALGEAAHRVPALGFDRPVRLALAGAPMGDIAAIVEGRLPANGRLAAAAFRLSDWSGARVADAFEGLAERATGAAELVRERRAATTQARLSAIVVGGAPVAFALLLFASGRGSGLMAHGPIGGFVLASGLVLEILGLGLVAVIVRRAER